MSLKKEMKKEATFDKSEIILKLAKSEILERQVSAFGTGCHVIVPKEYIGKKVKIVFGDIK
jgi:putative transposon-encoded protein